MSLSQNIVSPLKADTLPRPMRASQPAVPSTYPNKRSPYTGDGPNTPKTRRTLFDFRGLFLWWVRQACVSYLLVPSGHSISTYSAKLVNTGFANTHQTQPHPHSVSPPPCVGGNQLPYQNSHKYRSHHPMLHPTGYLSNNQQRHSPHHDPLHSANS